MQATTGYTDNRRNEVGYPLWEKTLNTDRYGQTIEKYNKQREHKQRGRKKRNKTHSFIPNEQQLIAGKRMICRQLQRGKLYASNIRDAASRLRKKLGDAARRLGHTPHQAQVTLERALMDLIGVQKVVGDRYGFMLAA